MKIPYDSVIDKDYSPDFIDSDSLICEKTNLKQATLGSKKTRNEKTERED